MTVEVGPYSDKLLTEDRIANIKEGLSGIDNLSVLVADNRIILIYENDPDPRALIGTGMLIGVLLANISAPAYNPVSDPEDPIVVNISGRDYDIPVDDDDDGLVKGTMIPKDFEGAVAMHMFAGAEAAYWAKIIDGQLMRSTDSAFSTSPEDADVVVIY